MPIYVGNQKIEMSGMDKVYVGTTLVYQKQAPVVTYTISYSKSVFGGTTPATKTVEAGYVLTSADLPTATENTTWSLTGWTINGTDKINVGYVVNSDIVLKAIHKGSITTANLFKQATQSKYLEEKGTVSVSSASMGNVGNFSTSTSSNTYALSRPSYSHSWNNYGQEGYCCAAHGAWGGIVATLTLSKSARVEWKPSTSSVTFTLPNGYTSENNYTGCYPGMVMRHTGTKAKIWGTSQNNTNNISHTSGSPNSGSTITVYCQYGGNNGSSNSQQLARRTGYKSWQSSSSSGSVTCSKSTASETIYIYTQG